MNNGNIMQVGTPEEIYRRPENPFVAGFIGISNFIDATVQSNESGAATVMMEDLIPLNMQLSRPYNGKAKLSARPEQLYFGSTAKEGSIPGVIDISVFLGDFTEYEIRLENGQTIQLNEYTKDTSEVRPDGEKVFVSFEASKVNLYTEDGEVLSC